MRALALILVCGCNGVPLGTATAAVGLPKVAAEPVIFAIPDETMEFHATLRGMHVGVVQTAIGKPGWVDGHRSIIFKSRGKTEGLVALLGDIVWELTTTIDLDHAVPLVDHEEAWAEVAGEKNHEDDSHTWSAEDHHQDIHSAVGALRGWRSAVGEHTVMQVGVGGGHFPLELWNAGPDRSDGKPAVRYDGIAGEFHWSMWISDDVARVPLAFRTESVLGDIGIELVDYQVPRDH